MDSAQTRVFVRQIIEVLKTGASLTGITIDDQIADMALKAVDNDTVWNWMWLLIGKLLSDEDVNVVGCEPPEAEVVGAINPLVLIAIVKAIVALLKAFRG